MFATSGKRPKVYWMIQKTTTGKFAAVQQHVNLVDLERSRKMQQNVDLIAEGGFDQAENGPSQVRVLS